MSEERWNAVKSLFQDVLERADDERAAFLERACGGDRELLDAVSALLARHRELGSFLAPSAASGPDEELSTRRLGVPPAPRQRLGDLLAGRYRLRELLGRGGSSTVYRAEDVLAGREVAVKLIAGQRGALSASMRREVAALRHLRLPGVVALLDDGVDGDVPFLVMELVRGTPFPGEGAGSWARIRERASGLLEALGRVHWAGVIHRDLKPSNVLVDAEGRLTVVDLGIAAGRALVDDPLCIPLACTPDYAAPELLDGGAPSERSDLYAVGVLLYECLTGAIPHRDGAESLFFDRRIHEPAPPLRCSDAAVDARVQALIARLLARDPTERPASAAEVLHELGGGGTPMPRRLGSGAPLAALVGAVRAGGPVRIVGPRGSGRSRLLCDLRAELERSGIATVRLQGGGAPFSSLDAVLGDPAQLAGLSLDEVERLVMHRLERALADGIVPLCDDYDAFDRWSTRILERVATHGTLVLVTRDDACPTVRLEPLSERELCEAFAGHDRLFHLREDAAHELWRRTDGLPSRVEAELGAWVRAGLARREDDGVVPTRAALELLRGGLAAGLASLPLCAGLPARLADVLETLDLCGGTATPELLARVTERPLWRLEAELVELEEAGAVRRGRELVLALAGVAPSAAARAGEVRRRIAAALAPGSEARLFHLLAAGELHAVPAEAAALAETLNRGGFVGRAWAVLLEGLAAVRDARCEGEGELLALVVRQALTLATRDALDQALYLLARARTYDEHTRDLEALARAAQWTIGGDGARALELLEALDVDSGLADLKRSVEGLASRYVPLARGRPVVARIVAAARARIGSEERRAAYDQLGWLRYREGAYARAAALHERAARAASSRWARVSALLNASSARMEDHDLAGAEQLAIEGLEVARLTRHPIQEARAEWLLRTIDYRRGAPLAADLELVDAAADLDFPNLQGLICLNEAAVAWRAGEIETARELALRAAAHWGGAGRTSGKMLADALALACGAQHAIIEHERILGEALRCAVPGMAIQALGLLAATSPSLRSRALEAAAELARSIPRERWPHRREVLSIAEALGDAVTLRPILPFRSRHGSDVTEGQSATS